MYTYIMNEKSRFVNNKNADKEIFRGDFYENLLSAKKGR